MRVFIPVRVAEERKAKHVDLILLQNEDTSHYVWIKDKSRLLANQLNQHKGKTYICGFCLHAFQSARILKINVERCKQHRPQLTQMPAEGEKLHFPARHQQHPLPFIIVGDFETLNEPIDTTVPDLSKPSTTPYANLTPCSAAYKIISVDPNYYSPPRLFKGESCISEFLDQLQTDVK